MDVDKYKKIKSSMGSYWLKKYDNRRFNIMKKSLTLIVALLLCLIVPMLAAAADPSAASDATITFTADTSPTDPVDPTDPDQSSTDTGTGMNGPLSIDYVPFLDFGSQVITGDVETYNVIDTKTHIQVTDKRGTGGGWRVTGALSNFVANDASLKSIPGAVISFENYTAVTTTGNLSDAPTGGNFSLTAGGSSAVVATAATDDGMGTWVERWFATNLLGTSNDHVKLTVNTANVYTKTYKATLTWTLLATP